MTKYNIAQRSYIQQASITTDGWYCLVLQHGVSKNI
jgi:hypothetical protein